MAATRRPNLPLAPHLFAALMLGCTVGVEERDPVPGNPNAGDSGGNPVDDDDTSDGDGIESDGGNPDAPTTPEISGFDIDAREGGWWKFKLTSDWDGYTPSNHEVVFLLVLGSPIEIDGDEAFPVDVLVLGSDDPEAPLTPTFEWDYLSFAGNRIRGSQGGELEPLFDAMTGIWPSTSEGLFGHLRTSGLLQATRDGGDWRVQVAESSSGCEVIPGYGEVCTDDPEFYLGWEKYRPGIGPSGSYFQGCSPDCLTDEYLLLDASPDGSKPQPKGCPVGDGLYCGGNLIEGDPDVLYECVGGELNVWDECVAGCIAAPPGELDMCA